MSLCFLEAIEAKNEGRIDEDEYFGHLTAHLHGVRHDQDRSDEQRWLNYLRYKDQFGALFRQFALNSNVLSAEATAQYKQLLQECSTGNLTAVESSFAALENNPALTIPVQALAVLVARKGRADVLSFLLDNGASLDREVDGAVARAVDTLDMLKLLWNRNWRGIQHSARQQAFIVFSARHKPIDILEFLLQQRVKFPPEVFNMPDSGETPLPVLKLLVRGCGIGALEGTAVLTLAVERRQWDVVEYLCKLGVPVDDIPPEFDIREPYATCSPLWAAAVNKDIDMMKLLLDHGADPYAPYTRDNNQSLLSGVQQHISDPELTRFLEEYVATSSANHEHEFRG